jgi:hypothetical protein
MRSAQNPSTSKARLNARDVWARFRPSSRSMEKSPSMRWRASLAASGSDGLPFTGMRSAWSSASIQSDLHIVAALDARAEASREPIPMRDREPPLPST